MDNTPSDPATAGSSAQAPDVEALPARLVRGLRGPRNPVLPKKPGFLGGREKSNAPGRACARAGGKLLLWALTKGAILLVAAEPDGALAQISIQHGQLDVAAVEGIGGVAQPESNRARKAASEAPATAPEIWIRPELFEGIRDKTRRLEPRLYFELLDIARRNRPELLEQRARRDLTFAQLVRSPQRYRGKLVFLHGRLRRLTELQLSRKPPGFKRLYEGWLFTDEAQNNPYVVIVSHVPEGMPRGGEIAQTVSVAGFFLKLWKYQAGDGSRFAPLLLGRRLIWHPQPAHTVPERWAYRAVFCLFALLVALLFAVVRWSDRSIRSARRRYRFSGHNAPARAPGPCTSGSEMSTEAFLKQLELEDNASETD